MVLSKDMKDMELQHKYIDCLSLSDNQKNNTNQQYFLLFLIYI